MTKPFCFILPVFNRHILAQELSKWVTHPLVTCACRPCRLSIPPEISSLFRCTPNVSLQDQRQNCWNLRDRGLPLSKLTYPALFPKQQHTTSRKVQGDEHLEQWHLVRGPSKIPLRNVRRISNKQQDYSSTKEGGRNTYPLPDSLNYDDVLEILHNHSVLSQIFWPHSSARVRIQPGSVSSMSNFLIEKDRSEFKASLCSQPDGVTCTEELPLGLKVTTKYVIAGCDQIAREQSVHDEKGGAVSTSNLLRSPITPLDHQLYLVEQRFATAFKLLTPWIQMKQGTLTKTENLMEVLKKLGESQKDLISALSDLNGIATYVAPHTSYEKANDG